MGLKFVNLRKEFFLIKFDKCKNFYFLIEIIIFIIIIYYNYKIIFENKIQLIRCVANH